MSGVGVILRDSGVRSASRFKVCQVFIFHFPSVIHGMKGGVTNQVSEWPFRYFASHLALDDVVSVSAASSGTFLHLR